MRVVAENDSGIGNTAKSSWRFSYDPRIKFLQILLTTTLAFALGGGDTGVLLFGAVLIFALLSGLFKTSLKFALIYAALLLLAEVAPLIFATMIRFFFLRVLTIALAMVILFSTTEITELMTSLQNIHIPQIIIIPFAMILRFIPSLKQDVIYIKQGMQTRGVGFSLGRVITHPVQTYEGFVVPILMRVLMTATELSASAETRGISYPCTKTHFLPVEFRIKDGIILLFMLILYAVIIWLSFQIF